MKYMLNCGKFFLMFASMIAEHRHVCPNCQLSVRFVTRYACGSTESTGRALPAQHILLRSLELGVLYNKSLWHR